MVINNPPPPPPPGQPPPGQPPSGRPPPGKSPHGPIVPNPPPPPPISESWPNMSPRTHIDTYRPSADTSRSGRPYSTNYRSTGVPPAPPHPSPLPLVDTYIPDYGAQGSVQRQNYRPENGTLVPAASMTGNRGRGVYRGYNNNGGYRGGNGGGGGVEGSGRGRYHRGESQDRRGGGGGLQGAAGGDAREMKKGDDDKLGGLRMEFSDLPLEGTKNSPVATATTTTSTMTAAVRPSFQQQQQQVEIRNPPFQHFGHTIPQHQQYLQPPPHRGSIHQNYPNQPIAIFSVDTNTLQAFRHPASMPTMVPSPPAAQKENSRPEIAENQNLKRPASRYADESQKSASKNQRLDSASPSRPMSAAEAWEHHKSRMAAQEAQAMKNLGEARQHQAPMQHQQPLIYSGNPAQGAPVHMGANLIGIPLGPHRALAGQQAGLQVPQPLGYRQYGPVIRQVRSAENLPQQQQPQGAIFAPQPSGAVPIVITSSMSSDESTTDHPQISKDVQNLLNLTVPARQYDKCQLYYPDLYKAFESSIQQLLDIQASLADIKTPPPPTSNTEADLRAQLKAQQEANIALQKRIGEEFTQAGKVPALLQRIKVLENSFQTFQMAKNKELEQRDRLVEDLGKRVETAERRNAAWTLLAMRAGGFSNLERAVERAVEYEMWKLEGKVKEMRVGGVGEGGAGGGDETEEDCAMEEDEH